MCQAITQLYWILQLFPAELREPDSTLLSENDDNSESEAEPPRTVEPFDVDTTHLAYSPLFVLGNILLCIVSCALIMIRSLTTSFTAMWSYFWLRERYIACQVTLIFNTSIHLYAVYALPSVLHGVPQGKKNLRTHLLSKTSAGIAILYMWKTWGIVDVCLLSFKLALHLRGAENDSTIDIRATANDCLLFVAGVYTS